MDAVTKEHMRNLLEFESDRATIEIAVNSIKTGLSPSEKLALFPGLGQLGNSDVSARLSHAEDTSDIQSALSAFPSFRRVVDSLKSSSTTPLGLEAAPDGGGMNASRPLTSMDDTLYAMEVELHRFSFFGQFHYANFYSFCKLKEQEIRNILWIAECIAHKQRATISKYVPIF